MPAHTRTFHDGTPWLPDRGRAGVERTARRLRIMRYSPDLSRTVAAASEPRVAGQPTAEPYRGLATISSPDVAPVQVQVCLVASSDERTGLPIWRGRVITEHQATLLGFAAADRIQLHIAGRTAPMTITSLGEAASEIAGCGKPPF